jgi:hypothetical protein
MASNDNNSKHKLEEVESSMVRKRLWLYDDDTGNDDSSDSSKEEEEMEELSSEETLMNQLDTSEEKFLAKRGCNIIFGDDSDTRAPSSEPRTPKSHRRSDEDSNDDDFWMHK